MPEARSKATTSKARFQMFPPNSHPADVLEELHMMTAALVVGFTVEFEDEDLPPNSRDGFGLIARMLSNAMLDASKLVSEKQSELRAELDALRRQLEATTRSAAAGPIGVAPSARDKNPAKDWDRPGIALTEDYEDPGAGSSSVKR